MSKGYQIYSAFIQSLPALDALKRVRVGDVKVMVAMVLRKTIDEVSLQDYITCHRQMVNDLPRLLGAEVTREKGRKLQQAIMVLKKQIIVPMTRELLKQKPMTAEAVPYLTYLHELGMKLWQGELMQEVCLTEEAQLGLAVHWQEIVNKEAVKGWLTEKTSNGGPVNLSRLLSLIGYFMTSHAEVKKKVKKADMADYVATMLHHTFENITIKTQLSKTPPKSVIGFLS